MIRKIIAIILLFIFFSFPVSASEDIYKEQFSELKTAEIYDALPSETREFLRENNLLPEDSDWVFNLTVQNVFTHIFGFLKSGFKTPFKSCLAILAVILVSAAISSNEFGGSVPKVTMYATTVSAAAIICVPVFSVVTAAANAMCGCTVFMTSFIPVFAVIVASNGMTATSVSMSSLLLGATQVVNYICNFVVMPLMSGYLSISVASSVSPLIEKSGIADGIKKISFWIMALLTTVFVGILGIQTAVGSSADTLTVKTAKFMIGSSVPVAGTALAEALSTVTASVGLLKSSVGIYGVVACIVIFLPLLAEIFLWRLGLNFTAAISDLFSVGKISALLRSVDNVVAVLMGIVLLTLAMFVISLAVVITAGKV